MYQVGELIQALIGYGRIGERKYCLVDACTTVMGGRQRQNAALADVAVCVDESETFKVQELHLPIYHALCAAVEEELFGGS